MTYVAAANFRLANIKPWTSGLVLTEGDATDAYLDLVIASVTTQVELDLNDDFEPPSPDNDETISATGNGLATLYLPRRTRSLTTVSTVDSYGTITAQAAGSYTLRSSLNAGGTAMVEGRRMDELEALNLTTTIWPWGANSITLVGKFGWAAVPDDIKRLVSLRVYDLVKATSDPLSRVQQRNTIDAQIIYGPSSEMTDIERRYTRTPVMSS